ncbi:tail fiber domain-containing protein [Flavobacterium lipolyticum]|uniref:Tail fiber domain-containing protein n=1 Tax=Flavobacterium lipolyticum TaxID=2893754 RepID=A0ABS8M6M2_9FLAO|nr:tail fiber domain-containing protein [Flavobacterium sp. F-126]MCC9020461.1 tail fiber domain-containing protein [Flavobacterium sp. F-126]
MKKIHRITGIILFVITIQLQAQGTDALKILPNGNVGIGTSTPTQGKFVVSGGESSYPSNFFIYGYKSSKVLEMNVLKNSIYASDGISALQFNVFSDERIKKILGESNNANDLDILSKIVITDYKMIDTVQRGNKVYKKVIAQQVEKVYPLAVITKQTEVIPNIYRLSTIHKSWIPVDTKDLVVADKIKLIFSGEEMLTEILEIKQNTIRVSCTREGTVFVYGKEVRDFHSVDYEAIGMLNVSATQALLKRIEVLEGEKFTLTKTVSALKKEQEKTDDRLRAIERVLVSEIAENK